MVFARMRAVLLFLRELFFVHTSSVKLQDDVWTKKKSLHLVIN